MSVFKTTFSRALLVYPSNDANVPFPNVITSGITTDFSSTRLEDNTAAFITDNIKEGDIVYNVTNSTSATVVRVSSETRLILNAEIFTDIDQQYIVYQASPQTGLGNQGCYIYIGDADTNYEVVTIGGDSVMFIRPTVGSVLPVQVIKVISGGSCIALW
jgi:hypothetical protein